MGDLIIMVKGDSVPKRLKGGGEDLMLQTCRVYCRLLILKVLMFRGKTIVLQRQLKSLGHIIKGRMMENLCYLTLIPVIARCK
jgi:hypothetical protein